MDLGIITDLIDKFLDISDWPGALVATALIVAGAWVLRAYILRR